MTVICCAWCGEDLARCQCGLDEPEESASAVTLESSPCARTAGADAVEADA